ncbi:MAG: PqqD family protein [Synoicihabitans sp.]
MTRFELNAPDATFEDCDGEIIVINLASGNYYSIRGSICHYWSELIAGRSTVEIINHVAATFSLSEDDVRPTVGKIVQQLLEEKILRPATAETPTGDITISGTAGKYEAPSLERYDDMQDLLLLDPVHEVDVTGWPHRPESEAKNS